MSDAVEEYKETMTAMLHQRELRELSRDEIEAPSLEILDACWFEMTDAQRAEVDLWVRGLGQNAETMREGANRRFLAQFLGPIREAARKFGYAVAVHGSLARDIDLVAIPWVEEASSAEELADTIRTLISGVFGSTLGGRTMDTRPHGRKTWSIATLELPAGSYVDLSVMPRMDATGSSA